MDLDLFAGLHGKGDGDRFEAGDQVEGAFFWDGAEALKSVGGDGQCAVWFGDANGLGVGLGYRLG